MASQRDSGEEAKALVEPNDSAQKGAKAAADKSNGSKSKVTEIRKRAYEIFRARHGGPGSEIGDWQKAEASVSADTTKVAAPKADDPKTNGAEADASKGVQMPANTGTIQDALSKLHSSIEHGLTQEEAATRLKKDGPNAIEEKHISPLKRFLTFLWGPIPWMIEIAAILSAVVRHWEDFVIIFFMLALNAIVGFWEEFKADNEIERRKRIPRFTCRVLREAKGVRGG